MLEIMGAGAEQVFCSLLGDLDEPGRRGGRSVRVGGDIHSWAPRSWQGVGLPGTLEYCLGNIS